MAQDIELRSFRRYSANDSDIEEYHEINTTNFAEETPTTTHAHIGLNEYDFFAKPDNKIGKKDSTRKKKGKKKEKSTNLMEIITTELAAVAVPIQENVISVSDSSVEQRNSYLERNPRPRTNVRRRISNFETEEGWSQRSGPININPTFPRVFDNVASHDHVIPVEYVKPSKFDDMVREMSTEDQQTAKFLDIEIKDIKFKCHHQFSLEKLLCVKLNELYDEYSNLKAEMKNIETNIKINRETRDNLKEELLKITTNKKDDIRYDQTVRKYTKSLLDLKEKHIKTLQTQKELIHKMCSLWSDIEMIREKTELTKFPDVLIITKNTIDEEDFEKEWNEVFNEEFSDMLDKVEYEFVTKYIEYKEVKFTQNLDDSAKRRISKPKLHIDEDVLKEEVEEIVNNIVRRDRVDVTLKNDEKIISDDGKSEMHTPINTYYFEIYVDDVLVCESDYFEGQHDKAFDIEFEESLSVQILEKNSTLRIVLKENDREVSTLKINLADIRKSNTNSEFVQQIFTYNDLIEPTSKYIGSGYNIKEIASHNKVRLKSSNMFKGNLYTACEIRIKMGWNDKLTQNRNETLKNSMDIGRQLKRLLLGVDKSTTDGLAEIIGKLYNRDVSNDEEVLKTLRNLCKMNARVEDKFPIDENSPEFVRLKLLHLRSNGGMAGLENKTVPIHASQISTEQLTCLQKSTETDIDLQYSHYKYSEMDPIELQRFIGAKYLQKLNKNLLRNLNDHLLRKTHKDVVRDFKDLSFRNLFTNQNNLALANISSSTKQQLLAEALGRDQEIRITILRAFNLPDRSKLLEEADEDLIAGFKVRPLRPFVRVSYNGVSAQTAPAIGCHPSWSQMVKINTKPSPLTSIQVNIFDEHKAHLSDGSDEEGTVHYRYCSSWLGGLQIPLHTVLSLGSFRGTFKLTTPPMLFGYETPVHSKQSAQSLIPAVTQLMKKEASFISLHITTNLAHLGGLQEYNQPIPNSGDDYLINHLNTFVTEYINAFPSRNISLTFIDSSGKNRCVTQFLQPIPLPDYEWFPKNPKVRSESALSKSSGMSKSSSSKSSDRRRESERISYQREERESIYSAISWKNGENQLEKVMQVCARYVSLIPTYEITESHTVTLMGLELLKVLHGSPIDHTLILASFFTYLGIRCWVAVGLGIPRGHSTFVLTKYDMTTRRTVLVNDQVKSKSLLSRNEGCIWYVHDAVTGERSELRDVGCPLKTVDFVFDNENIWVNIQSSLDCESVSFDFTRSSDWQQVFDKSVFVMKQPLVTDTGLYSPPADLERLRAGLEAKVREKVQKWRPHIKTIWNRYCSSLLREMLPQWEYWSFNQQEAKPGHSQRLKQLMVTYKMCGFPLNLPYVNTKSVLNTVKSTGIHTNADPNAEFGVAVEVYGYPNNVLSVWVFLASISRL